MSNLYMLEP